MGAQLRVLMVEDSEDDARLNLLELERAYSTVEHQRVDTEGAMREALASSSWDLVLLDYSLPEFGAPRALEIVRQHDRELPVILVSGLIGEATAVEMMRAGVHDYVLKDSLALLAPAVARVQLIAEAARKQRLAEQELRRSEERLRTVFESSRSGMALLDGSGRAELFNAALCEMLGYSRKEMQFLPMVSTLVSEDRERIFAGLTAVIKGDSTPAQFETRMVHKDGHIIQVMGSGSRLHLTDGTVRILLDISDVTDEKRLKEQLLVAQKSEALATLVAGVAHDFNNLLTIIGGNIELAQAEQPDSTWLKNADLAAGRAAQLVRNLLQFARHGDADRAAISLAEVGHRVLALVSETLDRRISLDIEIVDAGPVVWADAGQIEQVIMNLLVNARDAVMARVTAGVEGSDYVPSVAMSVGMCSSDDCSRRAAGCVAFVVRDNGIGMPPEVRERIFDPFFTTKGPGEGTGLGLSTAYGIVDDHGGRLSVVSEVGEGTSFTMELPVATEADVAALVASVEPALAAAPGGMKGSVLLVDDEPLLLEIAEEALTREGYTVVAVPTGGDALHAITERRFELALVDVAMPAPDGWDVLAALQESAPETRVVMASGHALGRQVAERGAAGFLQKPYGLRALLRTVEQHIGEPAGDAS